MALKRKSHLKKTRSFAMSQSRRTARIRRLKHMQARIASHHALFFMAQQND